MRATDLPAEDERAIHQTAKPLLEAFREHASEAWPDAPSALDEVRQSSGLAGPTAWHWTTRTRNLHGHPYEFYQRCGFGATGAMPDANGFGRPDIFLTKRVAGEAQSSTGAPSRSR